MGITWSLRVAPCLHQNDAQGTQQVIYNIPGAKALKAVTWSNQARYSIMHVIHSFRIWERCRHILFGVDPLHRPTCNWDLGCYISLRGRHPLLPLRGCNFDDYQMMWHAMVYAIQCASCSLGRHITVCIVVFTWPHLCHRGLYTATHNAIVLFTWPHTMWTIDALFCQQMI